jgi:DNA uptake protein ComE-like DNA-binding protein
MKTTAEKSSTPSRTAAQTATQPFFAPAVQAKMAVSEPSDKFEREADKMAGTVMRMANLDSKTKEEKVQRQATGNSPTQVGASAQSAIQTQNSGGEPLSRDVRHYMEPRFGTDFSNVRVHKDSQAASLSSQLSARAFTHQNHIYFSEGQYQPGSSEGKQLIAHELTHTIQQGQSDGKIHRAPAPVADAVQSSEVVRISSDTFTPSEKVRSEIEAQGHKGLAVRVMVQGLTAEGRIKVRVDSSKNFDSMAAGSMPLVNPWADKIGGMHIHFTIRNGEIKNGFASLKPAGGDKNDWLQYIKKNADLLGGAGLKVGNLPTPVNRFENGKLTLGVNNLRIEIGGFVDAQLNLLLENANKPKIDATADINVKGIAKGQLKLDNTQEKLTGEVSLTVDYKSFSGLAKVKYNPDGTVDIAGKAAYNANKLSGEVQFVATDLETANRFAKEAIAAAGGKENVQNAPPPAGVPEPKAGSKQRAIAATGQLAFNLTTWFAGTVHVVVDGKGNLTVIGKIAPPAEIELFKQRDWDKELIKFEAKAYYGIPVVGNLNLFANISLHALASLGPAKIYNIEILGTYSTDPEIQKSIQISGSINISAYAGLRLRAEGGAGIEILSHDLKFGVGLNADIGIKAYADARPTVGYREPGEFYVSGTLEMVAQPMLGLGGDFFIELETPWWSPLSDDKWVWPLFSKEWPLTDPIGINATVKEYVLGSGKVPEVELKKPEFDPSKFMTNMVDRTLPEKSGGKAAGQGSFKEDGSVPKPEVPPKKPEPKKAPPPARKKGAPPKAGKSAAPDLKAANDQQSTKVLQSAAKPLAGLKSKAPITRSDLNAELGKIKTQVGGIGFDVQEKGDNWSVTPKTKAKAGKPLVLKMKDPGKEKGKGRKDDRSEDKKKEDLDKALAEATRLEQTPHITEDQIRKELPAIKQRYAMTSLELVIDKQLDFKETVHIAGEINPKGKTREAEIDKEWAKSKSTVPEYGAPVSGSGSSVKIVSLTKDHPAGSGPSATGGLWETLKQRMDGGSTYYVRGHLLNDNLGGSGGEWRNLAPLTQATNNRSAVSMLHTFETKVKDAVKAGQAVEFNVTMKYGAKNRPKDVADANEIEPPSEGKKIAAIILAEQNVPTAVQGVAKAIGANNKRTDIANSTTINTIDTDVDHYTISATPRKTINLNKASDAELRSLNGVTADIAKRIIKARTFKDRDDFLKKLDDDVLWHKIVSTAGFRIRFK